MQEDAARVPPADDARLDYRGDGAAEDVLCWALDKFSPRIGLACSFQHTVLIHMMTRIRPDVRVFALDTGRMPEETYQCAAEVERRFGVRIEWYFPRHEAVEALMRAEGPYSFRGSVEARRRCCAVRKVEPLTRALAGLDAWIVGLRQDQGVTRRDTAKIALDPAHDNIVKVAPLADWSDERIADYAREHRLPYNRLMDRGYTSIGCACCTRAIEPDEDPRAGRWWWEQPEHKECGLHVRNWQI
jgi:phosphoadenosine phosphosulfate reductase